MSVENDFLPFAVGGSANVTSQSAYAADTSLLQDGFSSGIANSADLNKVWRQSSIMSAVLAQFIVQQTGQPAIDDGTTATLLANLMASVKSAATGRLLNVQVFDTPGAFTYMPIAGATTAIADVQAGAGQGGGSPATTGSTVGCGTGGHSGARIVGKFSLSSITSLTGQVGAGGSTGAAGASGQSGGSSSLGSLLSATGGPGGSPQGPTAGPVVVGNSSTLPSASAGTGVQIIIAQPGNSGMSAVIINSGAGYSGAGGLSPGYGGGTSVNGGTGTGNPGQQIGQGGSGAFTAVSGAAQVGGLGVRGRVVVYEYA